MWNLCQTTSLVPSQHWFRYWLDALRQQAITCANVDQCLYHYMVSLGCNELNWYDTTELTQYCGWWWPGALAPGHQQPQCWPSSDYTSTYVSQCVQTSHAEVMVASNANCSSAIIIPFEPGHQKQLLMISPNSSKPFAPGTIITTHNCQQFGNTTIA